MESRCIPCSEMDESSVLSEEDIDMHLSRLKLWKKNESGHLVRRFVAKSFVAAMEFVQLVGNVAEELGHHPDIHLTSFRNVEIVLYTHKVSGVTSMDIIEAQRIDALPVDYSPKWARENLHTA